MRYILGAAIALALIPLCVFLGYFLGYLLAPLLFADDLHPDFYEHDCQLTGAVYGIPFAGGLAYLIGLYLLWRFFPRRTGR